MTATIRNTGAAIWLPSTRRVGAVRLGCHLLSVDGQCLDYDFYRADLTPGECREVLPSEAITLEFMIPSLPAGSCLLEFDLVSEHVCWFVDTGLQPIRVPRRSE